MFRKKRKFNKRLVWGNLLFSVSLVFLLSVSLGKPVRAAGASLYLSPSIGTYVIGSTFSIAVKVNSGGEAINAAEGTLNFNPSRLQVLSLSKSGSIFNLWTEEPNFSNSSGIIKFGGGTNKKFTGSSGIIITISFQAKTIGTSNVNFSTGSVLAADFKGTNILTTMVSGSYVISPKKVIPTPPVGTPLAPGIDSPAYPDSEKWYSENNPEFTWEVPEDVTGVKLSFDHERVAIPTVFYSESMSEKKLEDLADGIWYFHVQLRNKFGWGGVSHFKFQIDATPPNPFEIEVDNGGDFTNPSPILYFDTTDKISGIEYYELKIGEGETIPIVAAYLKENPYQIPPQAPGKHSIIVKAVDLAENSTFASTDIIIEPIEAPVITEFPKIIRLGDILTIQGTSLYPDGTVTVFVKKEGEEVNKKDVKIDSEGNWFFVYDKSLDKGTYQIWAQLTDSRGAKSNPTEKITLAVTLPTILKFGRIVIDYLTVTITLAALIIILILFILYAWHRISLWRKRIRKETVETEEVLRKAFGSLRKELKKEIEMLDSRPGLNKEEKRIRDNLKATLKVAEESVAKEIKDIEKELE